MHFSKLGRISAYGSPIDFTNKNLKELQTLRENGLTLIYYGIETGSDKLLKIITKGTTKEKIISGLKKALISKIKISATVILGVGGKKYSKEHTKETASLINKVEITYLSTLQIMLDPKIKKRFIDKFKDDFIAQNDIELLEEQQEFIGQINPNSTIIFRSNHASNTLPLMGNLPKERDRLLEELETAKAYLKSLDF
jgi:radical SAM superfamily enzyme